MNEICAMDTGAVDEELDYHVEALDQLCRICQTFHTDSNLVDRMTLTKAFHVVYGIQVKLEVDEIYPPNVCLKCSDGLKKTALELKSGFDPSNSKILTTFTPHMRDCPLCVQFKIWKSGPSVNKPPTAQNNNVQATALALISNTEDDDVTTDDVNAPLSIRVVASAVDVLNEHDYTLKKSETDESRLKKELHDIEEPDSSSDLEDTSEREVDVTTFQKDGTLNAGVDDIIRSVQGDGTSGDREDSLNAYATFDDIIVTTVDDDNVVVTTVDGNNVVETVDGNDVDVKTVDNTSVRPNRISDEDSSSNPADAKADNTDNTDNNAEPDRFDVTDVTAEDRKTESPEILDVEGVDRLAEKRARFLDVLSMSVKYSKKNVPDLPLEMEVEDGDNESSIAEAVKDEPCNDAETSATAKRPSWQCSSCLVSFKSQSKLVNHGLSAHKHPCRTCRMRFSNRSELNEHLRTWHAEGRPAVAIDLNKRPVIKLETLVTSQGEKSGKTYRCACNDVFTSLNLWTRHTAQCTLNLVPKTEPKPEPELAYGTYLEPVDESELEEEEPEEDLAKALVTTYKCGLCDTLFEDRDKCLRHSKSCPGFHCVICLKDFETPEMLEAHAVFCDGRVRCACCRQRMRTMKHQHEHWAPINSWMSSDCCCSICKKVMKMENLAAHLDNLHGGIIEMYSCDICHVETDRHTLLDNHLLLHMQDRPWYACDICEPGIWTVEKRVFNLHLLSNHLTAVRYACNLCPELRPTKTMRSRDDWFQHFLAAHQLCPICRRPCRQPAHCRTCCLPLFCNEPAMEQVDPGPAAIVPTYRRVFRRAFAGSMTHDPPIVDCPPSKVSTKPRILDHSASKADASLKSTISDREVRKCLENADKLESILLSARGEQYRAKYSNMVADRMIQSQRKKKPVAIRKRKLKKSVKTVTNDDDVKKKKKKKAKEKNTTTKERNKTTKEEKKTTTEEKKKKDVPTPRSDASSSEEDSLSKEDFSSKGYSSSEEPTTSANVLNDTHEKKSTSPEDEVPDDCSSSAEKPTNTTAGETELVLVDLSVAVLGDLSALPPTSDPRLFDRLLYKMSIDLPTAAKYINSGTRCSFCLLDLSTNVALAVHMLLVHTCYAAAEYFFKPFMKVDETSIDGRAVVKGKYRCVLCHLVLVDVPLGYLLRHAVECCVCCKCELRFPCKEMMDLHIDESPCGLGKRCHVLYPRLVCRICNKTFTILELIEHLSSHMDPENLSCNVCLVTLDSENDCSRHMGEHTDVRPYCFTCARYCSSLNEYKEHLEQDAKIHRKKKKASCWHCSYTTPTERDFRLHLLDEHLCQRCGLEFAQKKNLILHGENVACEPAERLGSTLATHVDEVRWLESVAEGANSYEEAACATCGRLFLSRRFMLGHVKRQHASKDSCEVCDFLSEKVEHLHRHQSAMHGTTSMEVSTQKGMVWHRCGECVFTCTSAYALHAHERTMHAHACPNCWVTVSTLAELIQHMSENHSEKKHRCRKCCCVLASKDELSEHVIGHDRERYVCAYCKSSFGRLEYASEHAAEKHDFETRLEFLPVTQHDNGAGAQGEEESQMGPVMCQHCGQVLDSLDIASHERRCLFDVKLAEIPCSKCNVTFQSEEALHRHSKVHVMVNTQGTQTAMNVSTPSPHETPQNQQPEQPAKTATSIRMRANDTVETKHVTQNVRKKPLTVTSAKKRAAQRSNAVPPNQRKKTVANAKTGKKRKNEGKKRSSRGKKKPKREEFRLSETSDSDLSDQIPYDDEVEEEPQVDEEMPEENDVENESEIESEKEEEEEPQVDEEMPEENDVESESEIESEEEEEEEEEEAEEDDANLVRLRKQHPKLYEKAQNVEYSCAACEDDPETNSRFPSLKLLNEHMETVHNSVPEFDDNPAVRYEGDQSAGSACKDCGKFYTSKQGLLYHKKTVHGYQPPVKEPKEALFACGMCSKTYKSKAGFIYHMKTAHIKTPSVANVLECEVCNRKFQSATALWKHSQQHD